MLPCRFEEVHAGIEGCINHLMRLRSLSVKRAYADDMEDLAHAIKGKVAELCPGEKFEEGLRSLVEQPDKLGKVGFVGSAFFWKSHRS